MVAEAKNTSKLRGITEDSHAPTAVEKVIHRMFARISLWAGNQEETKDRGLLLRNLRNHLPSSLKKALSHRHPPPQPMILPTELKNLTTS
jgi:hypothetical protein